MAKKMNVSVPDNLFERYENLKSNLSPSLIFQKALQNAVEREERFMQNLKGDNNMEEIITRLKAEKEENMSTMEDIGREDGLAWAKESHYEDLIRAVSFHPPMHQGEMLNFADYRADEHSLEYALFEFFQKYPEHVGNRTEYMTCEASKYVIGFLEAVAAFWKEVEPHLQ